MLVIMKETFLPPQSPVQGVINITPCAHSHIVHSHSKRTMKHGALRFASLSTLPKSSISSNKTGQDLTALMLRSPKRCLHRASKPEWYVGRVCLKTLIHFLLDVLPQIAV